MIIRELIASVRFDFDERGLDQANRRINRFGQGIQRIGTRIAGAFAGVVTVGAITNTTPRAPSAC